MLNKGVYTEAQLTALEEELDAEIKAAIARTEAAAVSEELSNPLAMFDYLYADMPPYLNEQREELKSHLDKQKAKAGKSPQHASGTAR